MSGVLCFLGLHKWRHYSYRMDFCIRCWATRPR